ncbi:MAG TPA: protein translocase subunit SecF [Acidimicrobiales bacterium]|nr:protein translocase subunit SecF [Acidimicrobiales bacterium]
MTDLDTRPQEDSAPEPKPSRGGLLHRLYHGESHFDFVGKRRIGFMISGALILISLLSLFTRGLNLGIEFEGGVAWEFPASHTSVSETRSTLEKFGINDGKIQTLRGSDGERIRAQAGPQTGATSSGVRQTLAENAQVDVGEVSFTSIGPTWGAEITHKAIRALVIFFILLALYITVRFEWRMAVGALAAVVHDVLISVGVYSVLGFEVTPATVIAFLTILGFSLYDTIVVFDKVHENTRRVLATGRATYGDIVNLSMNQVLARSLNTTLCAILPVMSLLFVGSILMGATALEDFALALLVGLITGSYSSIFIATPILAALKEREPRYKALKAKFGSTTVLSTIPAATALATLGSGSAGRPVAAAATAARPADATQAGAPPAGSSPGTAFGHPPRPRKKKKR